MPAPETQGSLDRRIIIQRNTSVSSSAFNEPVESWVILATVWASRRDASAMEGYRAMEVGSQITVRFCIRYSSEVADVNPKDRISYEGRIYNITSVREPENTRGRWIEIDAVARNDA